MRIIQLACLLFISVGYWACDNDSNEIGEKRPCCGDTSIIGEWRFTEQGWSAGAGYVVTEVPAFPKLFVTFSSDGTFKSNIDGLEAITYFEFTQDNDATRFLSLYVDKQGTANARFGVSVDNDKLRLVSTGCIEGCHLGFIRA